MCIIIDASVFAQVFRASSDRYDEYAPIRKNLY